MKHINLQINLLYYNGSFIVIYSMRCLYLHKDILDIEPFSSYVHISIYIGVESMGTG